MRYSEEKNEYFLTKKLMCSYMIRQVYYMQDNNMTWAWISIWSWITSLVWTIYV